MAARRPGADFSARDHRTQWHAAGDTLGGANDVPLEAPMFACEHFTGAAEAGLNLVDNKKNSMFSTEVLKHRQIFRGRYDVASLALDRLYEDAVECVRGRLVQKRSFDRLNRFAGA